MKTNTVRYTATLPAQYVDELRTLAKEKVIPSINYAVSEAVIEYVKSRKATQYENQMREAASDNAFLQRTLSCAEDFSVIDDEVPGTW